LDDDDFNNDLDFVTFVGAGIVSNSLFSILLFFFFEPTTLLLLMLLLQFNPIT
jgi:hypothetical protein